MQVAKEQKIDDDVRMDVEVEVNEEYLKPSKIYEATQPMVDLTTPTIFQIPLLPCFA